jgi:hypothetical protein
MTDAKKNPLSPEKSRSVAKPAHAQAVKRFQLLGGQTCDRTLRPKAAVPTTCLPCVLPGVPDQQRALDMHARKNVCPSVLCQTSAHCEGHDPIRHRSEWK